MTGADERREHSRHSYYAKAAFGEKLLGYIRNISECGARISVIRPTPFDAGEVLWLNTPASAEGALERTMRGKVVWSKCVGPYCDVGVSFEDADPPMRQNIHRFAQWLAERHRRGKLSADVKVEILEAMQNNE